MIGDVTYIVNSLVFHVRFPAVLKSFCNDELIKKVVECAEIDYRGL